MNASISRALLAGGLGSVTTNVIHEIVRRTIPAAPRVDLLGMQALAKATDATFDAAPRGRALYVATLAGDLVSNAAYFALVTRGPRAKPPRLAFGVLLGSMAGIGAVALPKTLGLTPDTTSRTPLTVALTIAIYTAGGLVAALASLESA